MSSLYFCVVWLVNRDNIIGNLRHYQMSQRLPLFLHHVIYLWMLCSMNGFEWIVWMLYVKISHAMVLLRQLECKFRKQSHHTYLSTGVHLSLSLVSPLRALSLSLSYPLLSVRLPCLLSSLFSYQLFLFSLALSSLYYPLLLLSLLSYPLSNLLFSLIISSLTCSSSLSPSLLLPLFSQWRCCRDAVSISGGRTAVSGMRCYRVQSA